MQRQKETHLHVRETQRHSESWRHTHTHTHTHTRMQGCKVRHTHTAQRSTTQTEWERVTKTHAHRGMFSLSHTHMHTHTKPKTKKDINATQISWKTQKSMYTETHSCPQWHQCGGTQNETHSNKETYDQKPRQRESKKESKAEIWTVWDGNKRQACSHVRRSKGVCLYPVTRLLQYLILITRTTLWNKHYPHFAHWDNEVQVQSQTSNKQR